MVRVRRQAGAGEQHGAAGKDLGRVPRLAPGQRVGRKHAVQAGAAVERAPAAPAVALADGRAARGQDQGGQGRAIREGFVADGLERVREVEGDDAAALLEGAPADGVERVREVEVDNARAPGEGVIASRFGSVRFGSEAHVFRCDEVRPAPFGRVAARFGSVRFGFAPAFGQFHNSTLRFGLLRPVRFGLIHSCPLCLGLSS